MAEGAMSSSAIHVTDQSESLPKKEALSKHTRFQELTVIEINPSPEADQLVTDFARKAKKFVTPIKEAGFLSEEEIETTVQFWKEAVTLDNSQLDEFISFAKKPWEAIIEIKRGEDPDLSDPDGRVVVGLCEDSIAQNNGIKENIPALVYRVSQEWLRLAHVDVENEENFLILNTNLINQISGQERWSTVFEETCHFLSKLNDYGLSRKWLEEASARVIWENSATFKEELSLEQQSQIKQSLRYEDYAWMFNLNGGQCKIDAGEFLSVFFGLQPLESEIITRMRKELPKLDSVCDLIDRGISVSVLQQIAKKENA